MRTIAYKDKVKLKQYMNKIHHTAEIESKELNNKQFIH